MVAEAKKAIALIANMVAGIHKARELTAPEEEE